MSRKKASDAEILYLLKKGMTQMQIADRLGCSQPSVCARVRKFKDEGIWPCTFREERSSELTEYTPGLFKKMDTVVRKRDRTWFRVIQIEDDFAKLVKLNYGEAGFRIGDPETMEVHLADLEMDYTRKEFPEVKCYNIYEKQEAEVNE